MYRHKPLIFLFIIVLLCNTSSISNAQVQIKTNEILVQAEETITVEFEVLNNEPINGMEFSIQLPGCMNFVRAKDEFSYNEYKVYIDQKEQSALNGISDFQVITSQQDDNCIKVLTFSPTAKQLTKNSRTLIKFDISVDDTFCMDETITISGMKIPALINDSTLAVYGFDEIDIAVNKARHTGISNIESEENNVLYTIDGKQTNRTHSNHIYIINGKKYFIKD